MAVYQSADFLFQFSHPSFNSRFSPGMRSPATGIYRCTGCGLEIVTLANERFPYSDKHERCDEFGPVCWRLVVLASS